ncbi:hypothetical protein GZL_01423 [Streptomyces sp. 769]|nr:hypothetical protein GZL_01423 [Streptomyces sp. 769]
MLALVAPAAAPAVAAGQPPKEGTYCTPWSGFYGHGRYTYADVRVCLRITSFELTQVSWQTDRVTYWHGISWHNPSNQYWATVGAQVEVKKEGETLFNHGHSTVQYKRQGDFEEGEFTQRECGTYWVTYKYLQVGPYYGQDKAINPPYWQGAQVEVPCAA